MVLTVLSGLRFEAYSPSRYVFRLEEKAEPVTLEYRGAVWHLSYPKEEAASFCTRDEATDYLRSQIDDAERRHKMQFDFCVVERFGEIT